MTATFAVAAVAFAAVLAALPLAGCERQGDELGRVPPERKATWQAAFNAGDAAGFWDLVRENRDDLKWCGSAPFYTFLKSIPNTRGELRNYEQWNIDDRSVVSFAGMSFTRS